MRSAPACEGDISPTVLARFQKHAQTQAFRAPLPKLDLPALDPDLRRGTTFRACSEKAIQDISYKYDGGTRGSVQKLDANDNIFMTAAESMRLKRADVSMAKVSQEPSNRLAVKCDVHYPLVPSAPSRTEHFEDTTAALSNYCLNNMLLCGNVEYSNVILWILHTSVTSPCKIQQSFTVLPNYLKPDRNALGTTCQWAIIVFRNDPGSSRLPAAVRQQETILQAALSNVLNMGYRVDVWTKSDNYCWRDQKLQALSSDDCRGPDQSLREKFQAMVGHGIPGFSFHEIQTIDDLLRIRGPASDSEDSETVYSEIALQTKLETEDELECGSNSWSEFDGFLEHMEESILPAGSDAKFEHDDDSNFSGVSEDLDMVMRLGGRASA
ncbi:hypothetical protein J7T55_009064 [Diaporthe amygdali]|uniref:uncharacterized protein n=1 Tax=Phomopsis amygdali TaxID=1214568 RepID=UPI0022FE6B94|nr:uncharacterized protein J7T55_009064 [Diaporthe amygdali]KAJ0118281.1 hypothetical protein J7T55_009064 [Diaporthe amygdali]